MPINEVKEKAFGLFTKLPMPSERDEPWRYTDISRLKLEELEKRAGNVSLLNGSKNVIFCDIKTALEKHPELLKHCFAIDATDKISAMQLALWENGAFAYVPEGAEASLKAVFGIGSYYNIIVAETGSRLDYMERFSGNANALNTSVTEVFAKENSEVNFCSIQDFSGNVYDFSSKRGVAEAGASINWVMGIFGGKLSRTLVETVLAGNGSKSDNLSVYLGNGNQHIDITTNAYHKANSTKNNMLSKGILKGSSSSVYRGLIKIEPTAKQTDTYLSSHSLVLGDRASSNPIPKLEIENNDIIRAGHGASVGHIDEDKLFYMMSRGLSREQAEELIISGFFDPALITISVKEVREELQKIIAEMINNENA